VGLGWGGGEVSHQRGGCQNFKGFFICRLWSLCRVRDLFVRTGGVLVRRRALGREGNIFQGGVPLGKAEEDLSFLERRFFYLRGFASREREVFPLRKGGSFLCADISYRLGRTLLGGRVFVSRR